MLEKIRPIENLSQVDKIEMTLQEYFRAEKFQPGDPLPKEIELAEAMGVSRTAIREALSRFRTLGLIESKKNRGMIFTKPDVFNNMERILNPQLLDEETMNEIFEMRLVIELGLGDILFLRKTKANLNKLERIVEKEEKTNKAIDIVKYDVEFHSMLYAISENSTIQRFQGMLLPIFDFVYKRVTENHDAFSQPDDVNYVSHRTLLNTLKHGTPEEFRNNMRKHLSMYFKTLGHL